MGKEPLFPNIGKVKTKTKILVTLLQNNESHQLSLPSLSISKRCLPRSNSKSMSYKVECEEICGSHDDSDYDINKDIGISSDDSESDNSHTQLSRKPRIPALLRLSEHDKHFEPN